MEVAQDVRMSGWTACFEGCDPGLETRPGSSTEKESALIAPSGALICKPPPPYELRTFTTKLTSTLIFLSYAICSELTSTIEHNRIKALSLALRLVLSLLHERALTDIKHANMRPLLPHILLSYVP